MYGRNLVSQMEAARRWQKRNPDKVKAANLRWKEKNLDKWKSYQTKYQSKYAKNRWREIDAHPEKFLYSYAKKRARENELEFTISVDDIDIPEACPLLGILMFYEAGTRYNPHAPSIDRRDNTKGYTPDNIWVISRKANAMKNNASIEELKAFATNVLSLF